jgi:hypothetical protein
MDAVRERCVEPQHGAWAGNAHNHLPIESASRGQFQVTAADQVEATGVFALREERSLCRQADRARDELKIG